MQKGYRTHVYLVRTYQWSQIRRVAPVGNVVGATVKTLSRAVGKWVAPVVKVVCVHAGTRKEVRW